MTPMTVAMMMFTALSLIESASMPASSRRAAHLAACGEDEPFLVVGAVAEYRGACVNEDAVDACLAAARCSIIDAEAVGPPDACGDAIKGRVHRV